jgi:hypothetical protein
MAKGSAMGLWKGKKGSSVFYQIKNTNSLQKQGIRERNYEPSNPQSARQASQRMRMFPAQAVYGVLKDTIERSWQGVKYGQMTRQAYLKSALRSELYPAVSKGAGVIVPGPYQIAKGSLGEVKASLTEDGAAIIGFHIATPAPGEKKISDLSSALLEANTWLKEGDQITFVLCYTGDAAIVQFNWYVGSFYINTTNEEAITQETGIFPLGFEFDWGGGGIQFSTVDEQFIYAAACIVSREGTTPLRSNATLAVNAAALPDYYGAAARAKAQRSYMKALTVQSTDWPVDPGTEGGSGDDTLTYTVSQVTLDEEGKETTTVGGTVSGGGSYLPGETVGLTATPAANYLFQGWFPSKADALANTNRISANAVYAFAAGDEVFTSRTIVGKFAHEL